MKIDFVSDLHVDIWWQTTKTWTKDGPQPVRDDGSPLYVDWPWYHKEAGGDGEILIIAGDISNQLDQVKVVLNQAAEVYQLVIFVDGNHEHYNRKAYTSNLGRLIDMQTERITFLHAGAPFTVVGSVAFIGLNSWYDWRCYEQQGITYDAARLAWHKGINDVRYIDFNDGYPDKLAEQAAKLLAQTVTKLSGSVQEIILISHTCPNADLLKMQPLPDWNRVTPSFVNSKLADVISADVHKKITNWIYGHTHARGDKVIDHVRYLNNACGYPRESSSWRLQRIDA